MQIVVKSPVQSPVPSGAELERFIPWQELATALGVGWVGINGMIRRGELPHMTKVGLRRSGWYEGTLRAAGIRFKGA